MNPSIAFIFNSLAPGEVMENRDVAQQDLIRTVGRLRLQSIPEQVAEKLREEIIAGRLAPGQRLLEHKLAIGLRIGQPTVREALKELEYEGFVTRIPQKGTYVTKLSEHDLRQILDVRMALEVFAVGKAAQNMTHSAAQGLKEAVATMESSAKHLDLTTFHRADLAFHCGIWDLAGNRYLQKTLERVAFGLFAFVLLKRQGGNIDDLAASVKQHRLILDGLLSGDPAVAHKAFTESTWEFWSQHHLNTSQTGSGEPSITD